MPISLHSRSRQRELMDEADISFIEFSDCLRELETINVLTLAYRPTLRWVTKMVDNAAARPSSVLDVGSGGGDMLRHISRLKAIKSPPTLIGIDLNPWSKKAAEALGDNGGSISYETGNIFDFNPGRKVDLIISSLFTHHLTDAELVRFIRWMELHTTRGWFINDLHRHWLPYYFIKLATRLFSSNRLIRNDAAVSVSRAFTRQDWQRILQMAGLSEADVQISWHFPFRFCVSRKMTEAKH